jgi:hypothetical protein
MTALGVQGVRGKQFAKAKKAAKTSLDAAQKRSLRSGLAPVEQALYNYADWQS